MSTFWTLDRVRAALQGLSDRNMPAGRDALRAISTDTRTIEPGDCFVALRGERFDGHDHLADAVGSGAAAIIVDRDVPFGMLGVPVFVVSDTLVALGALGTYRRKAWNGVLIAVGGSNGKTSTKELLRATLSASFSVHATAGNLNNRIGVPLTLLAIPDDAELAVIEAGTSIPGEIAILRDIMVPDIAVITSVAEEHLEGFGDLAGVVREEAALADDVSCAVIPASHPEIGAAISARRTILAGIESGDVRAEHVEMQPDGTAVVTVEGTPLPMRLRGMHNVRNFMLAVAVARELGMSFEDIARGASNARSPSMRASWEQIGSSLVINDAYNSNPASALAALEMLSMAPGAHKVAVLGTMRELGPTSDALHDRVARAALDSKADVIAGVGDFGAALERVGGTNERILSAPDSEALWPLLQPKLSSGSTILLKASRGVRLEQLLPNISDWAARAC